MEFFKKTTNIDFLGIRRAVMIVTAVLMILSVALVFVRGLNLGLDFTGGTVVELGYQETPDLDEVRRLLEESEFSGAIVQFYGSSHEVMVRLPPHGELDSAEISGRVLEVLQAGGQKVELRRVEFVGAQVGEELAEQGGLAMIYAAIGILIYVAMRFELRFAIASVVATVHDVVLVLGIFAATQMTFDLNILAAILAIIGYSLNDTVVVFDRVRENFRRMRTAGVVETFNASLNQTLSRTIMTGLTTMLVLAALLVQGGETLRGFSIALILGVVIGTWSSIYVASPVAIALGVSRKDLLPVEKEGADLPSRP
jgi:preprotein translocase subunit SecF